MLPPLRLRGFTGNTSQIFCQVSELNHLDEQAHEHQGRHRRKMRASSGSNEVLAQLNHKITSSPSVSVLGFNHLCKHTALLCLQLAAGFAITSQSACPQVFWVVGKCKLRTRRLAHKEFYPCRSALQSILHSLRSDFNLIRNVPRQGNLVILVSMTSIPALTRRPGCI